MNDRGMHNERRSETPVADTRLRSEINVSVFLQGAMLLALSGIGWLLSDINSKIGDLTSSQRVMTEQIINIKADVNRLIDNDKTQDIRLTAIEVTQSKGKEK